MWAITLAAAWFAMRRQGCQAGDLKMRMLHELTNVPLNLADICVRALCGDEGDGHLGHCDAKLKVPHAVECDLPVVGEANGVELDVRVATAPGEALVNDGVDDRVVKRGQVPDNGAKRVG